MAEAQPHQLFLIGTLSYWDMVLHLCVIGLLGGRAVSVVVAPTSPDGHNFVNEYVYICGSGVSSLMEKWHCFT